tara:strand:+ start:2686 stop:3945 length:1260 start_codon:yes stop_codon:yes gene_type:complete
MIKAKYFIISLLFISSCSNFLTWHLDRGIHKDSSVDTTQVTQEASNEDEISYESNLNIELKWSTSVNAGIEGNSAYLQIKKVNNELYSVDTDGLLSAVDASTGNILWNVPTGQNISSGLSVINNNICVGSSDAKLLCYKIESLSVNEYTPFISSISNTVSFSDYNADLSIDLITELASPISSTNNLFLLKLDNDDLYLIEPNKNEVIWKSESQNIPLRTKGSSMPSIVSNSVFIARDNGSIASYNVIDGTLQWFTILSSRAGRNDLESQRDAEMNIVFDDNKLFYGHFQGELNALDIGTGDIIWSSPFSFINDILIDNNSIIGSTSNNFLISLDQASGFLNWRNQFSDKIITQPFIIGNTVMVFTTDGTLMAYRRDDGTKLYEKEFGFDLHPQTKFITNKDKIYFQTLDGDIVHLIITF